MYSAHAQELYQYLVWDVDAEEDVHDTITNDFFEAIDRDQSGREAKSDKKKKKSSKKKKSTTSTSSEESGESSTSDPWIKLMFSICRWQTGQFQVILHLPRPINITTLAVLHRQPSHLVSMPECAWIHAMQLGKSKEEERKEGKEGIEEEKELIVWWIIREEEEKEEVEGRQGQGQGQKGNTWRESEAWTEGARCTGEGSEKESHWCCEQGKFGGDRPTNCHKIHTHTSKNATSQNLQQSPYLRGTSQANVCFLGST